jgi:hypothetical protein
MTFSLYAVNENSPMGALHINFVDWGNLSEFIFSNVEIDEIDRYMWNLNMGYRVSAKVVKKLVSFLNDVLKNRAEYRSKIEAVNESNKRQANFERTLKSRSKAKGDLIIVPLCSGLSFGLVEKFARFCEHTNGFSIW